MQPETLTRHVHKHMHEACWNTSPESAGTTPARRVKTLGMITSWRSTAAIKLALASRGDKTTLSLREQRATNVFWLRSDFKARVAARVVLDEKLYIQQN